MFGIRPQVGHVVGVVQADVDQRALRDEVPQDLGVGDCAAHDAGYRGDESLAFLDDEIECGELVELRECRSVRAEGFRLVAARLLPFGVLPQVLHGGRQCDRRRVVRRHHQENHVVDDVVVRESFTVFGFDVAQHREQVVSFVRTSCGQVAAEELLESGAALDSSSPSGAGQWVAHNGRRRLHTPDERLVDLVHFSRRGTFGPTHEDRGGEAEGEFLDGRVGAETFSGPPASRVFSIAGCMDSV